MQSGGRRFRTRRRIARFGRYFRQAWFSACLLAAAAAHADTQAGQSILGTWLVEDGEATVGIDRCGDAFCGRITWLKEPLFPPDDDGGMAGRPKIDRNNPSIVRRADPVLGKSILSGLRFNGAAWESGQLYDPETGRTYTCSATLTAADRLTIRGYVGWRFLGRTEVWTRLPAHD
jgi:uncharacterized protein (DUF2147 family)